MSEMPLALFALILFVVALLTVTQWVFLRLRRIDAALYDELGRPDLFLNNNLPNIIAFWKWVYGRSLHYVGDAGIAVALWAIRIGTILYAIGLLVFMVLPAM